jgi:hypothetical protein
MNDNNVRPLFTPDSEKFGPRGNMIRDRINKVAEELAKRQEIATAAAKVAVLGYWKVSAEHDIDYVDWPRSQKEVEMYANGYRAAMLVTVEEIMQRFHQELGTLDHRRQKKFFLFEIEKIVRTV